VNSAVFPGAQGGPLMHVIAAKAVCFREAAKPEFKEYAQQILDNTQAMAKVFTERGLKLTSGGSDNHLVLIDLRPSHPDLTGKQAQFALEAANITTNRNTVPGETRSPFQTSGLRIGSPAVTTRGMKEADMAVIANTICDILDAPEDEAVIAQGKETMVALCKRYPLPY
jgi:glycine hydroxymethyltransferase